VTSAAPGSLLLVHRSTLILDGLRDALSASGAHNVRAVSGLPEARLELAARRASVVVCDSEIDAASTRDLVMELAASGAESVVVLAPTVSDDDLVGALEAGALGYLSRDTELDRIVYDILGALRGEACLPRDKLAVVLRVLIDRKRNDDERSARLSRLSRRESEVLGLLGQGARNEDIAARLFLSQATVRTHVQNILSKLEVHSRLEAIALVHSPGSPSNGLEER
jgi:DNA-binding NarL/FixJ family response regulator